MSQAGEDQSNNLLMLHAAISKSLQDIAKSVSEEEFFKILTILESNPSAIRKLHKVMEDALFNSMDQDLEDLVTDECMVNGMKKLAKLTEDTTVPKNAKLWRPPGNVNLHMRSMDAEKIKNECEKLETYINNVKKENVELMEKVTKKRDKIQYISDQIKQLLNIPFKLAELENTVKFNEECLEKLYDSIS